MKSSPSPYRGRIAPSPTGWLHLGHARTFWTAFRRARAAEGVLVLRNDDLDGSRSRSEYVGGFLEDLAWLGLRWQEGPDVGGAYGPYSQSERLLRYRDVFRSLQAGGFLFPCTCSRRDIASAVQAPHAGDEEPPYPGTCRHRSAADPDLAGRRVAWRFRVEAGQSITFQDGFLGHHHYVAGRDFGDFVVWRPDELPSYQLACTVDDHQMAITEVVRGADLLVSTARQMLLFRALGWTAPSYFHCPLVTDEHGVRLAKRHDALSLKTLRARGTTPEQLRSEWG